MIAGFMTQMCVDTTARQAAHLGFKVTVLADATAALGVTGPDGTSIPHDQVHRTHLGSLRGFLADIKRVDAKLGNEKFVANAPEELVEEEKEKRDAALARKAKILEALERLKHAS